MRAETIFGYMIDLTDILDKDIVKDIHMKGLHDSLKVLGCSDVTMPMKHGQISIVTDDKYHWTKLIWCLAFSKHNIEENVLGELYEKLDKNVPDNIASEMNDILDAIIDLYKIKEEPSRYIELNIIKWFNLY